jgi:predicted transglutaminase-like cysteine proteinase
MQGRRVSIVLAAWLAMSALCAATPGLAAERNRADEPFGAAPYDVPEGLLWARWRTVRAHISVDMDLLANCRADQAGCRLPEALRFLRIVDHAARLQGKARLDDVNRALNAAIGWQSKLAGTWMAPLATLITGRGDCMEYSIAKYVALREAKVAADDLRILIVWDGWVGQYHAVVAARDQGRWWLLDNRTAALGEDSAFWNYIPLFAISDRGIQQFSPPSPFRINDRLAGTMTPLSGN